MSGLIKELKRRNVFRVAVAYLVLGWVILQIMDVVFPALQLPEWTVSFVTVLLMMGFPVAMLFAWAFELTPDGVRKASEMDPHYMPAGIGGRKLDFVVIGVLALALAYTLWQGGFDSSEQTAGDAKDGAPRKTIAVLPFINMSSDPEQVYFSDGISEEILNVLAGIKDLRVTSRTSAFAFRGTQKSIPEIAAALGVDHILEGSVRKANNRIRVTAQLIRVDNDSHLWSATYDRELADVFEVQDEISRAIADALTLTLGTSARTERPTRDMEAYQLFLKGRGLWTSRQSLAVRAGIRDLEAALEKDPDFAVARANLALAYYIAGRWSDIDRPVAEAKSREHALQALAQDVNLGEAFAALSNGFKGRDVPAIHAMTKHQLVSKAVELEPQNSLILTWFASHLANVGHTRQALQAINSAAAIDPLVGHIQGWRARIALMAGQPDTARRALDAAHAVGWHGHDDALFFLEWAEGNHDKATDTLIQKDGTTGQEAAEIRAFWAWAGARDTGTLAADTPMPPPAPAFAALHYLSSEEMLGAALSGALNVNNASQMALWLPDASGRLLRNGRVFQTWARTTGHTEFWRSVGWPDLCRESSATSFSCD